MNKRRLTLALGAYDYLQPLRAGLVQPEGIDLNLLEVDCAPRHHRMFLHGEYDACEFSMGTYLVARSQGLDGLQALPFVARRMFSHRWCFVRAGSEIERPTDLKGRRVGVLSYQNSLAIFVKAMLVHQYGVALDDVTWVTVGPEKAPTALPPTIKRTRAAPGKTLEALLLAGEVDALASPDLPQAWLARTGVLARLFPTYEPEEREFYRRTQLFPIMHVIVVKKEVLDRDPWIATSLYAALLESRRRYEEWIRQPHRISQVWPRVDEERELFGKAPFYQGFAENRHDLEGMIRFAAEQGLLARSLVPEELFAANTLQT